MSNRLDARDLTRDFGSDAGVFNVDLAVAPGEVHALVGLNGAGKTTLMRLILGMLTPSTGTVSIGGQNIDSPRFAGWEQVGHVVEQPFLYPELDVTSNLALAAKLRGVPTRNVTGMVADITEELNLGRYRRVKARRLSQGNRQRAGIAAALQHHPDLLVIDEPTNALDPAGVILLREALLRRVAAGAGILVSSHHLDEVARIAHRITVINHGHIIGSIPPTGTDIERRFFAMVHHDDERNLR